MKNSLGKDKVESISILLKEVTEQGWTSLCKDQCH
jgi:hypothetical protein